MSSEKKVRVTVEACGEVRAFECRGAALSTACEFDDALCVAFSQAGIPDRNARKLLTIAAHGANPHGRAVSVQTTDLDAHREIRDMAAELGVDADF